MNEIWKDVIGYENNYQVSNLGRIKSKTTRRIISTCDNKSGYLYVDLYKNNIRKRIYVHKLVAEHFIDNPENKECVNHKDKNRKNNIVDNLEWCTYKENNDYSSTNKALQRTLGHKVVKLGCDDKPIELYASIRCAARYNNTSDSNILKAIKNNSKHRGYKYKKFYMLSFIKIYGKDVVDNLLSNLINDL